MKRIGILTFHRAVNYGAFLQCFSFSERLKSEFPNCKIEVVDYIAPLEQKKIYKNILRAGYHHGFVNMINEIKKGQVFKRSLSNLPLSPEKFKTGHLDNLFKYMNDRYDVVVVGSDAIFNWNQNGFPSAFLLNYDFDCSILSYAASVHGMKYKTINSFQKEYCNNSFSKFSFIGVRDKNTEDFVRYCGEHLQPVHTCDPTVFMDMDKVHKKAGNWKERITKKYKINLSKPIIISMTQQEDIAKAIKERYGNKYQIITLFKYSKYADHFLYDLNPFEWAALLSISSITFTEYFHGTLLTLKNGRPVIAIDTSKYDGDYEGKLKDLMVTRLNLSDFYYTKGELEQEDHINKMFEVADKAIDNQYDQAIRKGMDLESEHIRPFINHLKQLL